MLNFSLEKLKAWFKLKEVISQEKWSIFFYEREVWFMKMWDNVWFEQNWKWKNFRRPVLILRKFDSNIFFWIPLTSKKKKWNYYCDISFNSKWKNSNSVCILFQTRAFDRRRLSQRIWIIDKTQFTTIKNKLKSLF